MHPFSHSLRSLFICVLACLIPTAALACSCLRSDIGFLIEPGTELPANARGVPWSGSLQWDGQALLPVGKDLFTVERLDGDEPGKVAFDVEMLSGQLLTAGDVLALVMPREGFEVGGRYRFTYRSPYHPLPKGQGEIEVEVSQEVFAPENTVSERTVLKSTDESTANLVIWKNLVDQVRVTTLSGSCDVEILAAQAGVEMELPDDLASWRDALLYITRVDGELYRPSHTLCDPPPPGRSWVGLARELVFTTCAQDPTIYARPESGVPEGNHHVEMIAWLPGTEHSYRVQREVVLSCGSEQGEQGVRRLDTLREPVWGLKPNLQLSPLEETSLVLADGTELVVILYGAEDPKIERRLMIWRADPEGRFTRVHTEHSRRLGFTLIERKDEFFLAVRQTVPPTDRSGERSATKIYHLGSGDPASIEVERSGPCGEAPPPLGFDWGSFREPGYQIANGEIAFAGETADSVHFTGTADLVRRGEGFVLTAIDCR